MVNAMEAWQNYLTMMEHKAQKLPGPARNLWWFGVQYERIYYLGDFLWIHSLLFSHPPKFFFSTNLHICATSCCANNLPCCVTSVLCKCVAPTLHFAASPPRLPSPLSLFITSLYFYPRSWSCIFRLRPPISSIEILLVEIMSLIADIFRLMMMSLAG